MRVHASAPCRALLLLLLLISLLAVVVAAQIPTSATPAENDTAANVTALRSDLVHMRSLVAQMQGNLAQVTSTQTPLKHQFELEIEAWSALIDTLDRRLDALAPRKMKTPAATPAAAAIPPDGRFHSLVENRRLHAFALNLGPHTKSPIFQNAHDVIWIAVESGQWIFFHDGLPQPVQMRAGEARFLERHQVQTAQNSDDEPRLAVVVELEQPVLGLAGCPCTAEMESSVCGCGAGAHLPGLWAANLGNVTLAGTTLQSGESFARATPRGDSLLVAITPLSLEDQTDNTAIDLAPGQALWLPAGVHRFKNLGNSPARFVTLELL